jgi:membrane-bound lytic murein transglycosylase D
VLFWENIYSRYTTTQGVLHDTNDLGRVYGVVELVGWEESGSARINQERIRAAKERIIAILTDLGDGKPPATAEAQRIAALFPRQRHTTFHKARENLRVQIGQKDRYYQGLLRSGKYIAHFKQYFASQGLPKDLAYLPHVESSFNPKAFSKVGAAGLWQFTRGTGKEYMRVDNLIDERLDPYLSTQAAARLLKQNHNQLGTWPLALTAYNHGRTGMRRALNEMGSYEKIFTSYKQGSFQFASRNFYSEFLAAMRVAKRMEATPGIPFEKPEATVSFRLKGATPVARLQASFRLSPGEFARLNPALLEPILSGKQPAPKGFLFRLPAQNKAVAAVKAQANLTAKAQPATDRRAAIAPAPPESHARAKAPQQRHRVEKGDTSYGIARRYGISHQQLMAANSRSAQAAIRIGETLIIPPRSSVPMEQQPKSPPTSN